MDTPLTPKKIQRLMYLAEDKSFNAPGYSSQFGRPTNSAQTASMISLTMPDQSCSGQSPSLSSGVLDLDHCEGFGETPLGNLSLSKSSTFNPGEMTGRSTDAEDVCHLAPTSTYSEFGRYSVNSIENLTKKLNQQSTDVKELMRQSIASTYSFHSKRDLSADEASLVMREAPLPVAASQINLKDSMMVSEQDQSDRSVGAYFQNRCAEFSQMLPRTDSPSYDLSNLTIHVLDDSITAISEAASSTRARGRFDATLDSVPVRQPKPLLNVTSNVGYVPASPASTASSKSAMPPPAYKGPPGPRGPHSQPGPPAGPPPGPPPGPLGAPGHQHLRARPDENNSSGDYDSLSISKIGDIMYKESILNISDMLKHPRIQKQVHKHNPLQEVDMNTESRRLNSVQVTTLVESKKSETASSAGTINTIIDTSKYRSNQENLHQTKLSVTTDSDKTRSKSPSSKKSPSTKSTATCSTVQDNFASTTMQSGDSPLHSTKAPIASPNIVYRELDKSVDWRDVMRPRRAGSLPGVTEQWAEVTAQSVDGFVGVNSPAVIKIQSQSDSWLTARFEFNLPQESKDLTIDLPRFPILITPKKTEEFTVQITSNTEINMALPYTLYLKDSSIDCDVEIKGDVAVKLRMPTLQAVSSGGMNKVVFQSVEEGKTISKCFVLISDCPVDLQLNLTVYGEMFTIANVQEIKKSDVTKKLLDCQEEKGKKGRGSSKQMCRLSSGNAIIVMITFNAPQLEGDRTGEKTITQWLHVHLIGINALLKKVELIAAVGFARLVSQLPSNKVHLTSEVTSILLSNAGSVGGAWAACLREPPAAQLFKLYSERLQLAPGAAAPLRVAYTGPEDTLHECTLDIQDSSGRSHLSFQLSGGRAQPKPFPVKTSCAALSWVRPGRKEISLKNSTDKRIHLKCRIVGEGFKIDLPRFSGQTILLAFGPLECRPLPVVFSPSGPAPAAATLHLAYERDNEISRKVCLFGCAGGAPLRWRGLVTYGDTALVRALARRPAELQLASRADAPAFISADVHFNLQYMSASATSQLSGARRVIPPRGLATLTLHLDWAHVEKRAREAAASTALATITVVTGAEITRRRILKVLRESSGGELSLPEHLRRLAGPFEGEDPALDDQLVDFHETKASLEELVGGLQELSAQLELPLELADDRTILIADETVLDHHTLCE